MARRKGTTPDSLRLIHVTTVPMTLHFFRGQIAFLKERGFVVQAISSPDDEGSLAAYARDQGIGVHAVPMARRMAPAADLVSLARLCRLLRWLRPDVVHSHSPKAALLGTLAARMTGVPHVVVSIFGLPQMTKTGLSRSVLNAVTRLECLLSDKVWCDSSSMRSYVIEQRLCRANKVVVLANGSVNGVDSTKGFSPDYQAAHPKRIRELMGIPSQHLVIGFVGRITADKGMHELAQAWRLLSEERSDVHLLLVGPFELEDPLSAEDFVLFHEHSRVHLAGMQEDVASFLAAMDIFVMPSHREGFGVTNIEAASMCLPVVSTSIPGCVDSVQDGVTGTLVPAKDTGRLLIAIRRYCDDAELRHEHGQAGRRRALADFRPEDIWQQLSCLYHGLAAEPRAHDPAKRALDLAIAVPFFILTLPIQAATALAIRARLGSPVLFRQTRPGLQGKPFEMVKFRTMAPVDHAHGLTDDASRMTPLGRWLRSTSLDELPTLGNIIRGDMSLVGPRPLLMRYLDRYTPEQSRRHGVKPGLTGLAQVSGRNALSWDEKFRLDVDYVDHHTFLGDVGILRDTVLSVLSRDGIAAGGQATMTEFLGTDRPRQSP